MKKVLILTAGFGEGHNAAARNLRDALDVVSDEVRVEILDLFESTYGAMNTLARNVVQYAPKFWGGVHTLLDNSKWLGNGAGFGRLKNALGDLVHETQPDCVVSTYPLYASVIQELYRDHSERPFRFITVVTDSIAINPAWYRSPSDLFCVANEATAEVLKNAGVPAEKIRALGFPVSHLFTESPVAPLPPPVGSEPRRLLYVINSGKKKAGKALDRLLELPDTQLTITVGRDAELRAKLIERTAEYGDRVRVFGWTNQMPQLLLSSHLVIGKAGDAFVQEAIAAQCPIIVNQVTPGQDEGNARLVTEYDLGAVAERNREVPDLVKEAFAHKARLWQQWRRNLSRVSRPDAALRLAELVLGETETAATAGRPIKLFSPPVKHADTPRHAATRMLLCDFHIHTNYSDGKLTVPEVVDFYGRLGFDAICVTDHLADPRRLIGKLARLTNMTVSESQLEEYFEVIERERRRAWRKYEMIVMAGIEFNKDGYTQKTSAHLLGIGLQGPIPSALDLPETIAQIHAQGGLAVASHPHIMKSEWGKNTLYLWENHEKFAPLIDAWEIANRNNIFDCVGMKRLPFLGNSDFHKPKHIYSWKTLLYCEKTEAAIKDCIRKNEHVSITLYRDHNQLAVNAGGHHAAVENSGTVLLPETVPLHAARTN